MTIELGSLLVRLEADLAQFRDEFQKAAAFSNSVTADIKKQLSSLESAFGSVGKAAGLFGVALGVAEIAEFVRGAEEAGVAVLELSERLKTGADDLQVYRYAATNVGASFDDVQMALTRFTTRIGEAAAGSETAADGFQRLGISIYRNGVGDLRAPNDAWREFADRIKSIQDPAKQAAAVAAVLGDRMGPRLVSFLAQGSQGFDAAGDAAKKWSGIVDEESLKVLKRTEDLQKRAKLELQALVDNLIASAPSLAERMFAPYLDYLGRLGSGIAALGRGEGIRIGPAAGPSGNFPPDNIHPPVAGSTASAPAAAPQLGLTLEQRKSFAEAVAKAEEMAAKDSEEAWKFFNDFLLSEWQKVEKAHQQYAEGIAQQEEMAAKDTSEAWDAFNKQQEAVGRELNLVADLKEQADAIRSAKVEWDGLSNGYRVNRTELDILIQTQRIYNEQLGISKDKARELAEQQVAAAEEIRKVEASVQKDLDNRKKLSSELESFSQSVFDHIGQAAANAFIAGGKSAIDYKAVVLSVLTDIELEFIKLAALNPLKNALFGGNSPTLSGASGLLGGGSSIGGFFGAGGTLDSFFHGGSGEGLANYGSADQFGDAIAAGFEAFADGGRPDPGMPSLVGEQGPELFTPDTAGTILPAGVTSSLGSGRRGGPAMFIDARGADQGQIRRLESMVHALHGSVEHRSVSAMRDIISRGGQPAARMQGRV